MADDPKEPPVTVSIPGAHILSDEERDALGQASSKPPERPSTLERAVQEIRSSVQSMQERGTLDNMRRAFMAPPSFAPAKQSERSSEQANVADRPSSTPTESGRFSLGDLVVLVSCALFAEPFCHAAAEAFLHEEYGRAALGFTLGVPAGLIGGTFYWWKRYLGKKARNIAVGVALAFGAVGLLLAFAYIAGPEMYRRATSPVPSVSLGADQIARIKAPLNARISQLQAALEDMAHQRDAALKQNPPQSLPPPSPISGPITWYENLTAWTTSDNEGQLLLGLGVRGTSSGFADLKDAYIISDVTGEKRTLQVSTAPGPILSPISEINQIPPGASVELWVTFKPPGIRPNDLLTQWHTFHFHAEYSGIVYDRVFDVTALANQFPNMGPHVTKKVPVK